CLGIPGDHCDLDTKLMKFRDGFMGFGPNLVLDSESAEQSPVCDDRENRLSLGRPGGRKFFNFRGTVTLSSLNRRGPPIMTLLPFTRACAPRPGSASKSAARNVGRF